MSYGQNRSIAQRFIQEIFNEGKIEEAKKFVTPDIIYHGVFEEVRGLEDFKQWIVEDRKAIPDMEFTILDDFAEQNKVAVRWTLKGTHEKDFAGFQASHQKFEAHGADIFHFEKDKIKEAWTIFDALKPALQMGIVESVQPVQSENL
jgi:steroid delta-isomerase-like uncharacterized protein